MIKNILAFIGAVVIAITIAAAIDEELENRRLEKRGIYVGE